jgi:AraC family transcriptional regulator
MESTQTTQLTRSEPRAAASTAPRAALAPHRVSAVVSFVEEHLQEPIGVHRLAAVINLSPFHFARMFKAAVGCPPHVYITNARMERAKGLLTVSNMSLREIATTVGYQTQAHFTGVFHKHVGTTPRMYRVKSREAAAAGAAPGQSAVTTGLQAPA